MRTIKFRAWDIYAKRMRLVKSINYADDGFAETVSVALVDGKSHRYVHGESCELLHFTGRLDKNGVEIYEGDIVTNLTKEFSGNGFCGKNLRMSVEWEEDELYYGLNIIDTEGTFGFKKLTKNSAKNIEVIGNIYEGVRDE